MRAVPLRALEGGVVRTATGTECDFYYEDLHRGAQRRECRVSRGRGSLAWRPADCERCPVPEILQRAGSPGLGVRITVRALPFGLARTVRVESWCERHMLDVSEPLLGCPACRAETDAVLQAALGDEFDAEDEATPRSLKRGHTPSD